MEIKSKVVLKDKGQVVNLPTVKQLIAKLEWKSKVDVDLMAFGVTKTGDAFSVFSDAISKDAKTMGNLNAFPFMTLSEDAGIGAEGGDNEEILKITQLDDVATLHIIALNYTGAVKDNGDPPTTSFADYDAKVTLMSESGEAFEVPLEATEPGHVALIATIDNTSAIGATLKRTNEVRSLREFIDGDTAKGFVAVAGANALLK